MAVLSADAQIPVLNGTAVKLGIKAIGADTFYAGALVYADSANGKCQAVPAAGDTFLGICAKNKVAAAADELVEVYIDGTFLLPFIGAAEADAGRGVYMDIGTTQTDNPADLVSQADITLAANDILIGKCKSISGSSGWVTLHQLDGIVTADAGTTPFML